MSGTGVVLARKAKQMSRRELVCCCCWFRRNESRDSNPVLASDVARLICDVPNGWMGRALGWVVGGPEGGGSERDSEYSGGATFTRFGSFVRVVSTGEWGSCVRPLYPPVSPEEGGRRSGSTRVGKATAQLESVARGDERPGSKGQDVLPRRSSPLRWGDGGRGGVVNTPSGV